MGVSSGQSCCQSSSEAKLVHRGVGEHIARTSQRLFVQAVILCDMLYCTFFSALQGRQLDRLQGPRTCRPPVASAAFWNVPSF